MNENTFLGTEIKTRAIASVSALGIKVTFELINDGFEQIEQFCCQVEVQRWPGKVALANKSQESNFFSHSYP